MKTMLKILVVLAGVALLQGCQSAETKDTSTAITKADVATADAKKVEARAFKKKELQKQTAEKTAQREKARAEKLQASVTYKDSTGRLVYHRAEIDPSYSGGNEEMRAFLKKNLKYPEAARENGFEGTVFVDFVIDEKGRVRNVLATDVVGEDVDFSLKEESVRVVASMPLWKPGMQHGKSVDTSFSIPITFEID